MQPPFPPLLRRMLALVIVGFMILAATMPSWWITLGGAGTNKVLSLANDICPDAARTLGRPLIADGAHALDRAVLRRIAAVIKIGPDCFKTSSTQRRKGLDEQSL